MWNLRGGSARLRFKPLREDVPALGTHCPQIVTEMRLPYLATGRKVRMWWGNLPKKTPFVRATTAEINAAWTLTKCWLRSTSYWLKQNTGRKSPFFSLQLCSVSLVPSIGGQLEKEKCGMQNSVLVKMGEGYFWSWKTVNK